MSNPADFEGHDSRAVANHFVRLSFEANRQLTILHLTKFVYLAHGWTLGFTEKPLICAPIEAHRFGPVIPEIYRAFCPQGIIVRDYARNWLNKPFEEEFDLAETDIMNSVYNHYSKKDYDSLASISSFVLSQLPYNPHRAIDNRSIGRFLSYMIEKGQNRNG